LKSSPRSLLSFPSYHKSQPLSHDFHIGVAAETPWSFSVKIMKEEGEGREKKIQGRKRRSPFSTVQQLAGLAAGIDKKTDLIKLR